MIETTAERFQINAKMVTKWRDRFLAEGENSLLDHTSRPVSQLADELGLCW